MTRNLVEEYGITEDVLKAMVPGSQIGPFGQGYMVNPNLRRGAPNSGYPESQLVIKRYEKPVWGIINLLSEVSRTGPKAGGQSSEEVIQELFGDHHSLPVEIKNLGE